MSSAQVVPIATLAPGPVVVEKVEVKPVGYRISEGWASLVLWFIIVAVIAWFVLYSLRPTWVQQRGADGLPTGQVDAGRVLLAAIVIALIIVLIVWLLRANCR